MTMSQATVWHAAVTSTVSLVVSVGIDSVAFTIFLL